MNCLENIMHSSHTLPDAFKAYSLMTKLESINISHNPLLTNVPKGIGHVPRSGLKLILTGNPKLKQFPYSLCSSNTLSYLDVSQSNASTSIDWSGQLFEIDDGNIKINQACGDALYDTLETLSLANNKLVCKGTMYDDSLKQNCSLIGINKFVKLRYINLDNNNLTRLNIAAVSNLNHVLEKDGGVVTLHNNNIESLHLTGYSSSVTKKWLGAVLQTCGVEHLTNLNLYANNVVYQTHMIHSPLLQSIQTLTIMRLSTNAWTDLYNIFSNKKSLVEIDCSDMLLTDVNGEFDNVVNVKYLRLDGNRLTYDGIKNTFKYLHNAFRTESNSKYTESRSTIRLTRNAITSLKNVVVDLQYLQYLYVDSNPLKEIDLRDIPTGIILLDIQQVQATQFFRADTWQHPVLRKIDMHDNLLSTFNFSGASKLAFIVASENNLRHLNKEMFFNTSLTSIRLSTNKINTIDVETFDGCEMNYIDLRFNQLKSFNVDIFRKMNKSEWDKSLFYDYEYDSYTNNQYSKRNMNFEFNIGIRLEGNLMNESMKDLVSNYFTEELGTFEVVDLTLKTDGMNYVMEPSLGYSTSQKEMVGKLRVLKHKMGMFTVTL